MIMKFICSDFAMTSMPDHLILRSRAFIVALFSSAFASAYLSAVPPVLASGYSVLRATIMARIKAEILNGGLSYYRAASCMYEQNGGVCLIERSQNGYLYRFLGGPPGWQQLGKAPTSETEMLVAPDGRSVISVIYNGPIR